MSTLFPTKTRLALLRAAASLTIAYDAHTRTYWLDDRAEPVRVTARVQEAIATGWLQPGPPISRVLVKGYLVILTDAGWAVFAAHGGAA